MSAPPSGSIGYNRHRAMVVVEGATVRPFLTETAAMIIFAILGSLTAIGMLCWLLFTLAVFALPALIGVSAGIWAHQTGAGIVGTIVIGAFAAGITLGVGQLLLAVLRPTWLKLLVALAFVAPAAIAGFHAAHGIVRHTMPSETWQSVFSIVGAIAVAVTAFIRVTTVIPPVWSAGVSQTPECRANRRRTDSARKPPAPIIASGMRSGEEARATAPDPFPVSAH
jgi:MFS family permease